MQTLLESYVTVDESATQLSAAEVKTLIDDLLGRGVKYCMATWVDTYGRPKAKIAPVEKLARVMSGRGPLYGVHALEGMGPYGPADPDQSILPDPKSMLICPWDRQIAWFAGDIYWKGGEQYPLCSRTVLKRQLNRAAAMGLKFMVGIEPEFYVYRRTDDGTLQPFSPLDVGPTWGYDVDMAMNAMPFLDEVATCLKELDWGVDSFVQEGGHSQFEFDYGYDNALVTADRWVFLRELLKNVARHHGAFVTFMAKPLNGDMRSGAHYNMSLVDAKTGENLMIDGQDPRGLGLSQTAYHFIAGNLAHAYAITAVTCPTVNSYRGLVNSAGLQGLALDMSWAPVAATYGPNNRSAMLRVPGGRNCIENRATDPSCNIYLGLAMSLGAALDGIERKLDPGEPFTGSLYSLTPAEREQKKIQPLPQHLAEAISAFDADPLVDEVMGAELKAAYSALKHREWSDFLQHVSDWDRARYLEFF